MGNFLLDYMRLRGSGKVAPNFLVLQAAPLCPSHQGSTSRSHQGNQDFLRCPKVRFSFFDILGLRNVFALACFSFDLAVYWSLHGLSLIQYNIILFYIVVD